MTKEIESLYDVATDHEADVLDELRRRAGFIWECCGPDGLAPCWTNQRAATTCERCGTPRRERPKRAPRR